jgi:hypothetical protein
MRAKLLNATIFIERPSSRPQVRAPSCPPPRAVPHPALALHVLPPRAARVARTARAARDPPPVAPVRRVWEWGCLPVLQRAAPHPALALPVSLTLPVMPVAPVTPVPPVPPVAVHRVWEGPRRSCSCAVPPPVRQVCDTWYCCLCVALCLVCVAGVPCLCPSALALSTHASANAGMPQLRMASARTPLYDRLHSKANPAYAYAVTGKVISVAGGQVVVNGANLSCARVGWMEKGSTNYITGIATQGGDTRFTFEDPAGVKVGESIVLIPPVSFINHSHAPTRSPCALHVLSLCSPCALPVLSHTLSRALHVLSLCSPCALTRSHTLSMCSLVRPVGRRERKHYGVWDGEEEDGGEEQEGGAGGEVSAVSAG